MLFRTLALAALATTTIAHQLNDRHLHFHEARHVLDKRQDQQFSPTTTTATGDTCADAFGAGYETCREATATTNRLCYNPSVGQSCCSNSWACPSGSFCLTSGNCCPNGLDPNTCAAIISSSSAAQASSSAVKAVVPSTNSTTTVTKTSTSSVVLPSLSTAPYQVSTNATKVVASTGKPSSTTPAAQFTGAASRFELGAAGLLGLAGLVAGLL